jgi:hypothetical protein
MQFGAYLVADDRNSRCPEQDVGEFKKTRHPRNVKFDKVLETCFSGAGNSRFSEAWNLWSLEFANVQSSGNPDSVK